MNTLKNTEQQFYTELAKTPPMPNCYSEVSRHIRQKKVAVRSMWALAATLVIAVGLIPHHTVTTTVPQPVMVATEVADEINHIQTLFSDDYSSNESSSYSLVNNDLY
jgi:hypothetical protein